MNGTGIAAFPLDPEQLRQVFLNLGLNAIQAMEGHPRKEIMIRINPISLHHAPGFPLEKLTERLDRPGVLVELIDSGPGISAEMSSQIFEPFFTTKATGTGLGLAIVERIVQSHEGLITFDSSEGQGAAFRIWLPTDLKIGASMSGIRPAVV